MCQKENAFVVLLMIKLYCAAEAKDVTNVTN